MDGTLKVGVVQMVSENGATLANMRRAQSHIERAAADGAELILLPELAINGFELTEHLWDSATTIDGPIVKWVCEQAVKHRAYLGTSFLEAEGEDFYNTFVLASPEGRILGRVRKHPPASFEAFFYKAGDTSHIIDTPIGRIGVAICYENMFASRLREFGAAGVAIVLQPMSAPSPMASFPVRQRDVVRYERDIGSIAGIYARTLGVPALMSNKCGKFYSRLPAVRKEYRSRFPGLSCIAERDGAIKCALGDAEGVLVSVVTLGSASRPETIIDQHRRWIFPPAWFAFLIEWTRRKGERSYATNCRRAARAALVSRGSEHIGSGDA